MDVLPKYAVHDVDRQSAAGGKRAKTGLVVRIRARFTDAPIPFRTQNTGD